MSFVDSVPGEWLEQWNSMAFVGSGVAWLLLILLAVVNMSTGVSVPTWLIPAFLVVGLLAAYVGLLGFYPTVKDTAPRLSLAGLGATAVAATLVVVALLYTITTSSFTDGPPSPGFPLIILSTILGFLLLGTASVRTDAPSRTVGYLLIVPAVAWLGDIVYVVVISAVGVEAIAGIPLVVIPMAGVVIASVAMVATGYLLHTYSARPDRTEPASDATASSHPE